MSEELVKFLSKYARFSDDEVRIIREQSTIRTYPKGAILLREGDCASNTYLVLKGCVRSYYIKDGEERNTEFYVEHDLIMPVSYVKNTPSNYFLECMEETTCSLGTNERTEQFMRAYPKLAPICRKINEDIMASRQMSWDKFRNLTAEEHYLEIVVHRPDLLERIPQYHLASFLGIKPQSLSRIRKRLAETA